MGQDENSHRYTKVCACGCGREFGANRSSRRYATDYCRVKHNREKKKPPPNDIFGVDLSLLDIEARKELISQLEQIAKWEASNKSNELADYVFRLVLGLADHVGGSKKKLAVDKMIARNKRDRQEGRRGNQRKLI